MVVTLASGSDIVAPNNKPPQSRSDELAKKYGNALSAENGGFFNDLKEAQTAMLMNSLLGKRLGETPSWEYGSFIVDLSEVPFAPADYLVALGFSNWMYDLKINEGNSRAAATTVFEANPLYRWADSARGILQDRGDHRPTQYSVLLPDTSHAHPLTAKGGPSDGDWSTAGMRFPARNWVVDFTDGAIEYRTNRINFSEKNISSLISPSDFADLRGCFSDSRR